MQTILGANGQIAQELARELKRSYTDDLRLVSRNPRKVNQSDVLIAADLLDAQQTLEAAKGSDTQFVSLACEVFGKNISYSVINKWVLSVAGLFSKGAREIRELLPRYQQDNLFDSTKFKRRFPNFNVTTYREGLEEIRREWQGKKVG
ncbi:NAD(P)H-binding protein [Serratia liquefaciens]|uniref:NAD(P)H-binding protein n=1 Tax=Serratia liquefaciens TaxID=614 RepID=UPI00217AD4B2|nr:NAD(P)H-binding protein [Serratia liquefaciens]CAI1516606.1 Uncharacterised protein [Serratia liquefaciens]